MKKLIYPLLFTIILFVCFNVFFSAKKHVDTVKEVDELVVKTDSLKEEVIVLNKVKDSVISKVQSLDSTLCSKDSLISKQNFAIRTLRLDTAKLNKVSTIIIRDTVYITETKNFWGRRKKTIESSSATDSIEINVLDSIPTDTIQTY